MSRSPTLYQSPRAGLPRRALPAEAMARVRGYQRANLFEGHAGSGFV
jgi:hypothetical protein